MPERRPRINANLAAEIDRIRGDVPFERWVNRVVIDALGHRERPDIGALARAAGKESGLTDDERAAVAAKIDANAINGRRPREGLTRKEERALDVLGTSMLHMSTDDAETFRRIYWAGGNLGRR